MANSRDIQAKEPTGSGRFPSYLPWPAGDCRDLGLDGLIADGRVAIGHDVERSRSSEDGAVPAETLPQGPLGWMRGLAVANEQRIFEMRRRRARTSIWKRPFSTWFVHAIGARGDRTGISDGRAAERHKQLRRIDQTLRYGARKPQARLR